MPTYLLRVNLDITERDFKAHLRFKLAASSIKSLTKKNDKVIILSHLGRPKRSDRKLSLKKFTPALSATIGKKVRFISHFDFPKIKKRIGSSPRGSIFLLENLRFLPGETRNSKVLAKELASLGDRYINDDFATSHRAAASLVGITKFLPSQPGRILKGEVKNLKKARDYHRHPFILIIGGAKMIEKMGVIKNLLPKVDWVLVGGGPANNLLKVKGVKIGSSIYEPELISTARFLIKNKKIMIPVDWREEKNKILDIGPKTIKNYSEAIKNARTIIWNGPMGHFEERKFALGTKKIAKAIMKNKRAHTVIGGVETVASLPFKVNKQEYGKTFISTGGGAMLEFLADEELPALKVLNL